MTECQSARTSKIKNRGLDHYAAKPFEQQQFGTAGAEGVKKAVEESAHAQQEKHPDITLGQIIKKLLML